LPVATRPVGPPKEFQLTPEQKDRIAKMLEFWEQQTGKITTFRADFVRWTYDPVMGPKDGKAAFISGGEIRFAAPDRGMIKETKIAQYDVEKARKGEKWPYTEKKDAVGEHWVCDGKSIYEFQHEGKKLIETRLPPEMQGKAISQGPLPFMFGAKAATIQERYYIREIPRIKGDDPYHLELLPKGSGADFSRVRIRLDAKEFLPDVLEVYALNGVGKSTYQFNNRTINSVSDNVKNFWDSFVSPKPPRGWEKTTRNVGRPVVSKQARTPAAAKR
jgi:TIGR03009 family protein